MKVKEKKVKKRKPIFVYFILMVLLFFVLYFVQPLLAGLIFGSILGSRNGVSTLIEVIVTGIVLIIVLLFGNKYIFTQEKEKFSKGLKYILPELVMSFVFLLYSIFIIISRKNAFSPGNIINLIIYCLFIGIYEEFLCRGWLFNEFLERYSDSKKNIMLSIIFSSLIFGFLHYVNLAEVGRGFIDVTVQVINATVCGVFFALVYYKTKNIWLVVTSHAIWDFSLFLSDVNSLGNAVVVGSANSAMVLFSILSSIGMTVGYLFLCYWVYRKTDLYSKDNTKGNNWLAVCGCVIYLFNFFFINFNNGIPDGYYLYPEYSSEKLEGNYYQIHYVNNGDVKKINLKEVPLEFELDKDLNLRLRNINTNESVELDKNVVDYIVVENTDEYAILIQKSENTVLYGKFKTFDVKNSAKYLESVRNDLELIATPVISSLGTIQTEDDQYNYPAFYDDISNILYFNKDGKLKINN